MMGLTSLLFLIAITYNSDWKTYGQNIPVPYLQYCFYENLPSEAIQCINNQKLNHVQTTTSVLNDNRLKLPVILENAKDDNSEEDEKTDSTLPHSVNSTTPSNVQTTKKKCKPGAIKDPAPNCVKTCLQGVDKRCPKCSQVIVQYLKKSCPGRCIIPQEKFIQPNWSFSDAIAFLKFCEVYDTEFCTFLGFPKPKEVDDNIILDLCSRYKGVEEV